MFGESARARGGEVLERVRGRRGRGYGLAHLVDLLNGPVAEPHRALDEQPPPVLVLYPEHTNEQLQKQGGSAIAAAATAARAARAVRAGEQIGATERRRRGKGARITHAVPGRLGFSTAHPDGPRLD